jgi:hypothetical protein
MYLSDPAPLLVACSARTLIHPKSADATIQPNSTSLSRPTGVMGGTAPPDTAARARSMATAVARRCHRSSIAEGDTAWTVFLRLAISLPTPA